MRLHLCSVAGLVTAFLSVFVTASGQGALLERWVAEGAAYRAHWSFAPVATVSVPKRRGAAASTNPIDAFVRARLDEEGVSPCSLPEVLLRRLAFNLTGLPPAPEEVASFAADAAPDAYQRVVERYLHSPAYGERMALDWLDLARYADTYGYQNDVERDMSPYRDWVIAAFNRNLPYDRFLTWQLAGDLLPNATREQQIATAFNRLHRQTNEGGSIEEEFRTEYVLDRVNTFGTSMLGLTLECARCHDHKFDPITQRDYYSLSAFFNNIDESGLYSHFTNATPSPSLLLWPPGKEREHRRFLAEIQAVESKLRRISASARRPSGASKRNRDVRVPVPIAHLAFDSVTGTPDNVMPQGAELIDGPLAIDGALRFSGDNAVVHRGIPAFRRTDAFSLAIRLRPTERQDRAIVLHQSRAWSDAGSRGFELTLDHGRPFFGLIHFWPGNAIAVRATRPLPLHAWSHLLVTYDGSSGASGIRLYVNGRPLAVDIVRDRLFKDITYNKAAGDGVSDQPPFTIGARFRDSGFKNGFVDDLQIFATALTAAEASLAAGRQPLPSAGFGHFLARHHQPYMDAVAELQKLRAAESALIETVPEIMVMEEMRTVRPAHQLHRGAYDAPRELVPRDTPRSLPPFPAAQPRNRLGLARWLTDRRNPLAARVAVNRIWRLHFGRGLVATPEDFGTQGRRPTHQELLDFLATRFMESGWDVRALHRLIVGSDTFQQSSSDTAARAAPDPDNDLLARGPRRRLAAEEIRDAALAASGLLTRAIGGRSVKPYQPAGLWEQSGTGKTYKQDTGAHQYRRPDSRKPGTFAANCLLARRLAERGVKFVQLYHQGWDQHDNLPRDIHRQCRETDQACAALVIDLRRRGLLDDTLVVRGGEFGRTSYSQGKLTATNYGRDHHPRCFTVWIAGGGMKRGLVYGGTDDFSYNVTENPVHVHDFHATLLHALGIDHERLRYMYQGRRFRLTDVHGQVVKALLART